MQLLFVYYVFCVFLIRILLFLQIAGIRVHDYPVRHFFIAVLLLAIVGIQKVRIVPLLIKFGVKSLISDCPVAIFVHSALFFGTVENKQDFLIIAAVCAVGVRFGLHHGRLGVVQVLVALGEFAFLLKVLQRSQADLRLCQRHNRLLIVLRRL